MATQSIGVEQRNRDVVLSMIDALNAHDVPGMLACYTTDVEWYDIPMEKPIRGLKAVEVFLTELLDVFPDLKYELESLVVEGDIAVAQFRMQGTHSATYAGLPATGRALNFPSVSIITLRDEKIMSDHCYFDNAMILRQMGLMPSLQFTDSPPGRAILWLAVRRRLVAVATGAVMASALLSRAIRHR